MEHCHDQVTWIVYPYKVMPQLAKLANMTPIASGHHLALENGPNMVWMTINNTVVPCFDKSYMECGSNLAKPLKHM